MTRRRSYTRWTIQLCAGLVAALVLGITSDQTTNRPTVFDGGPSVVESFARLPWARLILGGIGGMLIAGGVMRLFRERLDNRAGHSDRAPRGRYATLAAAVLSRAGERLLIERDAPNKRRRRQTGKHRRRSSVTSTPTALSR